LPPLRRLRVPALLATAPAANVAAQGTAVLSGTVRDTLGQPLRGIVRVVGSALARVADERGRYRLDVPPGRVIVRIGHIGYRSVEDTRARSAGGSVARPCLPAGGP